MDADEDVPVVIAVMGSIAVGKTTFIHALSKCFREQGHKVTCVLENTDHYIETGALRRSYELPYGCSAPFQFLVLSDQYRTAVSMGLPSRDAEGTFSFDPSFSVTGPDGKPRGRANIVLVERTTDCGTLFVRIKYDQGNFAPEACEAYNNLLDLGVGLHADLHIFLFSSVADSMERLNLRSPNRVKAENSVDEEFLSRLSQEYSQLYDLVQNEEEENHVFSLEPRLQRNADDVEKEMTRLTGLVEDFVKKEPVRHTRKARFFRVCFDAARSSYVLNSSKQKEEEKALYF